MMVSKTTLLSSCLILSLVGNVVLAGKKGGDHPPEKELKSPESLRPIVRYMKDIPASKRGSLTNIVDPAEASLKEKYAELDKLRDHIAQLLIAKDIDKKQVEDGFVQYRTLTSDIQTTTQTAILNAVLAIPASDREAMMTMPVKKRAKKPDADE